MAAVVLLGLGSALATAYGTFLTKGLVTSMPVWEIVGPLYLLNALCGVPLLAAGGWQAGDPGVWLLHGASVAVMVVNTVAVFALLARGRASSVAVAQGLSPAAVLALGPVLVGGHPSLLSVVGTAVLVAGALLPLRSAFAGLVAVDAVAVMGVAGVATGALTALSAELTDRGVGVGPVYVLRTTAAAVVFLLVRRPPVLRFGAWLRLGRRSVLVSAGFVLTILAVQRGSPLLVQCLVATVPLLVTVMESVADQTRPGVREVAAAVICSGGVAILTLTTS